MREPSEALLSSALHRLASGSPRSAPACLQATLAERFRRHHRRRRRVRLAAGSAILACTLLIAGLAMLLHSPNAVNHAHRSPVTAEPQQKAPAGQTQVAAQSEQKDRAATAVKAKEREVAMRVQEDGFVALPGYDSAISNGELQVVRVELTASDLRMLGAPVAGDLSDRAVTADFITDRDGTPYAVKLIQ